jgi:hypothetical protein
VEAHGRQLVWMRLPELVIKTTKTRGEEKIESLCDGEALQLSTRVEPSLRTVLEDTVDDSLDF